MYIYFELGAVASWQSRLEMRSENARFINRPREIASHPCILYALLLGVPSVHGEIMCCKYYFET